MSSGSKSPAVLMIAYSYYESDARVIREAEAALAGGFEVDFLALRRPGTAKVEMIRGVRVLRLNQAKYRGRGYLSYLLGYLEFFLRCFAKTTTLFVRRRYRAIHVNNMPDFLVFATLVPRIFGSKVILDIHDPMPNTFASKFKGGEKGFFFRLLLWQERLSAAYASRVVTVHHPVRDGILLKHGLSAESIEVVANFPDADVFRLVPAFAVNGKVRFVFHGTILERSGLGILMNALAQSSHKDRMAVRIIGEGDFSASLKEMIGALQLERVVEFDNRSYPVTAIPERIADCSVGLVPLEISSVTNYALPLKLLEYISMGLPVLTVRSAAISYYLKEEDCMFFDWNDAQSLSRAMDRIAEDPNLLLRYRERSLALRGKFSWDGEKAKYIALLRELTGQSEIGKGANA